MNKWIVLHVVLMIFVAAPIALLARIVTGSLGEESDFGIAHVLGWAVPGLLVSFIVVAFPLNLFKGTKGKVRVWKYSLFWAVYLGINFLSIYGGIIREAERI